MQNLLLVLRGRAGLIQDKISHKTAKNFQGINFLHLCKSLFPDLPNGTLGAVHKYIGARCEQEDPPLTLGTITVRRTIPTLWPKLLRA